MKICKKTTWSEICMLCTAIWWLQSAAAVGPEKSLLTTGCSQYKVDNFSEFRRNLNASFMELRAQLGSNKYFATAEEPRGLEPVYTLVQCRKYLSNADCVACFDLAVGRISNCSSSNGARIILDGCFLRYESNTFYEQSSQEGHFGVCGNRTSNLQANVYQSLFANLQIATPQIDGFYVASKKVVPGSNAAVYGVAQCVESISKTGCQDCLKVAYSDLERCFPDANGWSTDVGCFLRYSDVPFFPNNQTINLEHFLKNGGSRHKKFLIAAVVAGAVGLLSLLAIAVLLWFRQSRKQQAESRDILGATELRGPVNYNYKDLKSATKNFCEEGKLGEGGFGEVYKGILKNGKAVAVKKLAIRQSLRAKEEFESEVKIISNVHHRNLVRLLGCCSRGPELLLVYEYMANSSLDKYLFGQRAGSLSWKQRYDIILGTARGLAYLHEDFHLCVIHRDIKTSNILLDDDFQPKIADFGLARLLPESQSHLSTKFAGTLGYTAPEYAIYGQLSEKVDVYSFGVVALEVVSGKKSNETKQDSTDQYLLKQTWKLYESGMHLELVDEGLNLKEEEAEEARKIIEIALSCTQSSATSRPSMSEVVTSLKNKGSLQLPPPTRPIFLDANEVLREDTSPSTGSFVSNATVSFSQTSAR